LIEKMTTDDLRDWVNSHGSISDTTVMLMVKINELIEVINSMGENENA